MRRCAALLGYGRVWDDAVRSAVSEMTASAHQEASPTPSFAASLNRWLGSDEPHAMTEGVHPLLQAMQAKHRGTDISFQDLLGIVDRAGRKLSDDELEKILAGCMRAERQDDEIISRFCTEAVRLGHALGRRSTALVLNFYDDCFKRANSESRRIRVARATVHLLHMAWENGVSLHSGALLIAVRNACRARDVDLLLGIPQREAVEASYVPRLYAYLMSAANAAGRHDATLSLFDEAMLRCEDPDAPPGSPPPPPPDALLSVLAPALPGNPLRYIREVVLPMFPTEGGAPADTVGPLTYAVVLELAATAADAEAVVNEMHSKGESVPSRALGKVVVACLRDGDCAAAQRHYLELSRRDGGPPPDVLVGILAQCEGRAQRVDDDYMRLAESCYDVLLAEAAVTPQSRDAYLRPATDSMYRLYSSLGLHGDAEYILQKMHHCKQY